MPVWSFTTDPFERELIFRSSYIKEAKCQQKYFDTSLVKPYENVIPFYCFSVNHRRKALCILPHLTLSFRHFKTASRTLFSRLRKLSMQWLSSLPNGDHLPPLPHTVLLTQPNQKITSIRIFYFNHYLLTKDLYEEFCYFLARYWEVHNTMKERWYFTWLIQALGMKSCANLPSISLQRIMVINLRILCQSQSQVTTTLPTKHWLIKKCRGCILHVHLLSNYWLLTLEQTWGSFTPLLLIHFITKQIQPSSA